MKAVVALIQALVGAAVQLGLAYQAGNRAARQQQTQTDQKVAENAAAAKLETVSADRAELLDGLQRSGRLRD